MRINSTIAIQQIKCQLSSESHKEALQGTKSPSAQTASADRGMDLLSGSELVPVNSSSLMGGPKGCPFLSAVTLLRYSHGKGCMHRR